MQAMRSCTTLRLVLGGDDGRGNRRVDGVSGSQLGTGLDHARVGAMKTFNGD